MFWNKKQQSTEYTRYVNSKSINNAANVEVNWALIEPISVERSFAGDWCTVVSYYDRDNTIRESYLYCNLEQHEKLVEDFKTHKASK